mmetsp:Transcript_19488/g.66052  ORF Transcript_19488/g.66052 Transcript_19488/m.66052 type:complete len:215 (+) Transcript_19488:865-1509(+)
MEGGRLPQLHARTAGGRCGAHPRPRAALDSHLPHSAGHSHASRLERRGPWKPPRACAGAHEGARPAMPRRAHEGGGHPPDPPAGRARPGGARPARLHGQRRLGDLPVVRGPPPGHPRGPAAPPQALGQRLSPGDAAARAAARGAAAAAAAVVAAAAPLVRRLLHGARAARLRLRRGGERARRQQVPAPRLWHAAHGGGRAHREGGARQLEAARH